MSNQKFRAWDEHKKKMWYFDFNDIFQEGFMCGDGNGPEFWSLDDLPVMQYIGLHDKNGKRIYEGDILKIYNESGLDYTYHLVIWGGEDYPSFDLEPTIVDDMNSFSYLICESNSLLFEIIGNIHETPELSENV